MSKTTKESNKIGLKNTGFITGHEERKAMGNEVCGYNK